MLSSVFEALIELSFVIDQYNAQFFSTPWEFYTKQVVFEPRSKWSGETKMSTFIKRGSRTYVSICYSRLILELSHFHRLLLKHDVFFGSRRTNSL